MLVDAVLPVEMRTRTLLVVGLCDCRLRYLVFFFKKKKKKSFYFQIVSAHLLIKAVLGF